MRNKTLQGTVFEKLFRLYCQMEEAYNSVADKIGLSCQGCPDNCCTSYFQHHTYIEWAYLWKGVKSCADEKQKVFVDKAAKYVAQSQVLMGQGLRPRIMCPLNDNGDCQLYEYRLMICRMHGVPNSFVKPDGQKMSFPGCFRCQELCSNLDEVPVLDRTGFYQELASLEITFVKTKAATALPRVRLTLAEMLMYEPTEI